MSGGGVQGGLVAELLSIPDLVFFMLDGCTSRVAIVLFKLLLFFAIKKLLLWYIEAVPNFIGSASQGQAMDPSMPR
jgi:hypothetical protein